MRVMGVMCVLLATSCAITDAAVLVQLVSDMSPGREIDVAVVTLDGADVVTTTIPATASLGRPVRLASFASVSVGRHAIGVSLQLQGREVLSRTVQREVGGATIVTVLMTRDCTGVVCPGTGSPTAVACLAGRCVEPECDEEHPELCPAPECHVDSDCAVAAVACAPERCSSSGVCYASPDDGLCRGGRLCDGQLGCVSTAVELPGIGTPLGTPFSDSCPPGEVLAGFDVYAAAGASTVVYGVTGSCARLAVTTSGTVSVTPTGALPIRGDPRFATATTQTCPADQVVVGLEGRSRTAVDQLAFTCAPLSLQSGLVVIGASTTLPATGGTGGLAVSRTCPEGSVATGRSGYADTVLEAFSLLCSPASAQLP